MKKSEQRTDLLSSTTHAAKGRMLVVAHRGSSGSAPENTMAAFEIALQSGADIIECDVRLTRDGEVVVFHDRNLDRTTNGNGPVESRTLGELKRLDAGSWFSAGFKGEQIPTLGEVLRLLDNRVFLNIELKADFRQHSRNTLLQKRVLEIIRVSRAERRVFLASFNHRMMYEIKEKHPQFKTAIIYKAVRDLAARPSRLVSRARADAFVCGRWWLRSRLLDDLHNHHIPLFVYTINKERDVERMKRRHVYGVITNHPEMVVRALDRLC
jgi:glycerophosphoryl diester phosphodiesterase